MTDKKTAMAAGLPDANLAAIGADAVSASNDAVAADGNAVPATTVPLVVGHLLRTTREAQGLTAGDVAAKLRMGLRQIVALESSDFASLPTGTFLRGFVRNYAKAVGLNADEVLTLLERSHDSAAAVKATPVVVPAQQNISMPAPGGDLATPKARAAAAALVVTLLFGAFWYWWEYVRPHLDEGGRAREVLVEQRVQAPSVLPITEPVSTMKTDPVVVVPVQKVPILAENAPPATAETAPPVAVPATPSRSPAQVPLAVVPATAVQLMDKPAPATTGAKSGGVLGFTFNGESWVQVIDGGGKTVLSKRFTAGEAEEVNGRPPFSVVIGNAQMTRMAFNGKEFDLVPYTRVSVARVTVK